MSDVKRALKEMYRNILVVDCRLQVLERRILGRPYTEDEMLEIIKKATSFIPEELRNEPTDH